MFRIIITIFLLFLHTGAALAACETSCTKSGTTYTCSDASYDCVNDARAAASVGDTILITDTNANTWTSALTITQGLHLKCDSGAGTAFQSFLSSTNTYANGTGYYSADGNKWDLTGQDDTGDLSFDVDLCD